MAALRIFVGEMIPMLVGQSGVVGAGADWPGGAARGAGVAGGIPSHPAGTAGRAAVAAGGANVAGGGADVADPSQPDVAAGGADVAGDMPPSHPGGLAIAGDMPPSHPDGAAAGGGKGGEVEEAGATVVSVITVLLS